MKALVAVKRVPLPSACLPVGEDGMLDLAGIRHVLNPWDEIALDLAVEAKAAGMVTEIVAVSVGPAKSEDILRAALARGADRAVLVEDDVTGPQRVALRLEEIIRQERPDLIFGGKSSSDDGDGQTMARLAGRLGRTLVPSPPTPSPTPRERGPGGEGVILAERCGREPRLLSLPEILQARRKPLERMTPTPLAETGEARILGYRRPGARPPCRMVADIPELVEALRTMGRPVEFDLPEARPYLGTESDLLALATVCGRKGWPMVAGVLAIRHENDRLICRREVHSGRLIAEISVPVSENVILIVPDAVRTNANRARIADLIAREATPVVCGEESIPLSRSFKTARVVVAGGRGLKDKEAFDQLVGGLAEALGGAVAAAGGAVNTGIAPSSVLVGQTGSSVSPDLYIALAISGADQHLAGFAQARRIVAINADPHAPIFRVADIGLVADARTAVPEWIARLQA